MPPAQAASPDTGQTGWTRGAWWCLPTVTDVQILQTVTDVVSAQDYGPFFSAPGTSGGVPATPLTSST